MDIDFITIMYVCAMDIDFVSFYDFWIGI
jgi:hypothetical protein